MIFRLFRSAATDAFKLDSLKEFYLSELQAIEDKLQKRQNAVNAIMFKLGSEQMIITSTMSKVAAEKAKQETN